jgi:aryl-alcohol dehydrogenase-like predicted oxidoreductase
VGTTFFGNSVELSGTRAILDTALDLGINFIDTADVYGDSEEYLGQAIEGRRDRIVLATKFGAREGASPSSVARAVESSLRRLRTDHIDLYQLHQPDDSVPIDETLGVLDKLVVDGKVREIGCSNFSVPQLEEATRVSLARGTRRFVTVQNELSLLRPASDVLPACELLDLKFIPYSPLASGILSGKYRRNEQPSDSTRLGRMPAEQSVRRLSPKNFDRLDRLTAFASERGHTLLELAFAWLLAHPQVGSVIAGATSPEQVRLNASAGSWRMSPDEARSALEASTA